jgi:alkanesulfonate monooxygenase SsuD/methylene tetrahydromethanopterin reductase-like flavin-dependent oxidoreductase (luciferase family)
VLSPIGDWPTVAAAAQAAEAGGLDAVGFWDHYHSERPEWPYVVGWSAYGALAATTQRVKLTPMVLCNLNYTLGVLAKESSVLALLSEGRFELAIGAGDYPVEYRAWHQPFPDATSRIERLDETVAALRRLWQGDLVSYEGRHVQLTDAASTPPPPSPPRVVVGVGGSRRTLARAVGYADELNVYASDEMVTAARDAIAASGRPVGLSTYLHLEPDAWPDDLVGSLARWRDAGVERAMVAVGFDGDVVGRVGRLAEARSALG